MILKKIKIYFIAFFSLALLGINLEISTLALRPSIELFNNLEPIDLTPQESDFFDSLSKETKKHIEYLYRIGLGERAQAIKLSKFFSDSKNYSQLNLTTFEKRTSIPQEVYNFDPHIKNTIITTDPNVLENNSEDLQKILDIRLYPTLRNLIKEHRTEIFLGSNEEMVAYYTSNNARILFEFQIPSSATYYLAKTKNNELFVIMAGLVSKENIIAQMLTLKLAKINLDTIEIIGETEHFSKIVKNDIKKLKNKIPQLTKGNNILIVAGCGLEEVVNKLIHNELPYQLGSSQVFKGTIVSLVYTPFKVPINSISGIISLDLNYGEITEKIITSFLKDFYCTYIFTGGAGGYIPEKSLLNPPIGSYIPISRCMNEQGEIVSIEEQSPPKEERLHLQIASIFLETYKWLESKRKIASSVDVETFYIMRAIQHYKKANPNLNITTHCGYFVSDYVGEKPLREYTKVYLNYKEVLGNFLRTTLDKK